jgi:hypothetical protein
MIKRLWRVFIAVITLGIVRLETKNAGAIRNQIVDEKVQQVASAERGLGELAGAVRAQTREVDRLEKEHRALSLRKAHFLEIVRASSPGSATATEGKAGALQYHRQLASVASDLNTARAELIRLANEYEASKQLIVQARGDVRDAKRKGVRLEQRRKSAVRREQLVKTTTSLRGLGGIGDDLAQLDEQIEAGIDALEGAAFVAADMASQEVSERHLDAQIQQQETDAAFEAELAAMEADTSEVVDVDSVVPRLTENAEGNKLPDFVGEPDREPVSARTTREAGSPGSVVNDD